MQNILAYVKKGTTPHSGNVVPLFLTPIVIFFIHGLHDLQEALHLSYALRPQHCLYFRPLPQGHGSFGYTLTFARFFGAFVADSSLLVPVTLATSSRSTFFSLNCC